MSEPFHANSTLTQCVKDYLHLCGLELATPVGQKGQGSPDILIGCDQYWDLLTGETVRGSNGPVATKISEQGWVLSWPIYLNISPSATTLVTHTLRVDSDSQQEASLLLENQLKYRNPEQGERDLKRV